MTRIIEWNGQPFALLVEGEGRSYLVPPVVIGEDGDVVQGIEILEAVARTGTGMSVPIVAGASVARLAEIDQEMARISEALGVPIWPPGWR